MDTKRCRRCDEDKPLNAFCVNRDTSDGLNPLCRECGKAKMRAYRESTRGRIITRTIPSNKICRRCRQNKPADAFDLNNSNRDGLFSYCKECRREHVRSAYHGPQRERMQKDKRQYWQKHREQVTAQQRAAYEADPEPWKARARAWRAANKDKVSHINRRTKAQRRGAEGSHTRREWRAMLQWFGHKCLRCGATDNLTEDHVTPIIFGGSHYIANIQPLCFSCNARKSDREMTDYRDPDELAAFLDSLR